jgi:hypothetical protein
MSVVVTCTLSNSELNLESVLSSDISGIGYILHHCVLHRLILRSTGIRQRLPTHFLCPIRHLLPTQKKKLNCLRKKLMVFLLLLLSFK